MAVKDQAEEQILNKPTDAEEMQMDEMYTMDIHGAKWLVLPQMSVQRSSGIFERLAIGCYDNGHRSGVNAEMFPIPEDGEIEEFQPVLVHFARHTPQEALEYAERHGLECPSPEHTLKVGSEMPELQKRHSIIAAGKKGTRSAYHSTYNQKYYPNDSDSVVIVLNAAPGTNERYLLTITWRGEYKNDCVLFVRKQI